MCLYGERWGLYTFGMYLRWWFDRTVSNTEEVLGIERAEMAKDNMHNTRL